MEGPAALRPRLLCSCTIRREGPALTPSVVCFPPSDLEDFVDDLKKDSTSASRVVTLKDVEDGAFLLRQVGEAVASLKGEPGPRWPAPPPRGSRSLLLVWPILAPGAGAAPFLLSGSCQGCKQRPIARVLSCFLYVLRIQVDVIKFQCTGQRTG